MSQIEIRQAQASDREAILAFCTQTWEWGDYIDRTWEDWLINPAGQLLVAISGQEPVGVVHMEMLDQTEAWLEGLRVNPDYRQQGIGRTLSEAAMGVAMQRGATAMRLAAASNNTASISLFESMHMQRVGDFSLYTAAPFATDSKHGAQQLLELAVPEDLDTIIDYLNASNIFPLVGGLYYIRFAGRPITSPFLEQKIAHKQIYLLRRWDRLDGLAIAEEIQYGMGEHFSVGYIDGTAIEAISLIAYELRRYLTLTALDNMRVYAPNTLLVHDAFDGAEYKADSELHYVYERGLV
jgi:ribosomal protein S18 acetylase RimI-like enzyme